MSSDNEVPGSPSDGLTPLAANKYAVYILAVVELLVIILFGTLTKEAFLAEDSTFADVYQMFTGILIMMLIGFAYLMTCFSRYGMSAIGLTMLITVLSIEWGILTEGFFEALYHNHWDKVKVDLMDFMDALFLAAAALISYGAVIGKTSPLQLIVLALLEAVFYSFNKVFWCFGIVDLVDAGGTVTIHMFGAYFGLAVAWMLGKPPKDADPKPSIVADTLSLVGTVFLWVYWPSFNSGALEPNSQQQQRAISCTLLALAASTTGTFIVSMSQSLEWKIRPVDIQNATLSGGVSVGAICALTLNFADSLLIGFIAGCASSLGYAYVQPYLEEKFGLHDSCGIHNLHGIPSVIGSLASIVLVAIKAPLGHDHPAVLVHKGDQQVTDQILAVVLTFLFSIVTGLLTGKILSLIKTESTVKCFEDDVYWEVEEAEHQAGKAEHQAGNHGHLYSHESKAITPLCPEQRDGSSGSNKVYPNDLPMHQASAGLVNVRSASHRRCIHASMQPCCAQ
jgi:ammonium transporter Rh